MTILYLLFILVLILITLPFQLVFGLLIVATSGMPILFRQKRIGKDGKPFILYKFRTMRIGAEKEQKRFFKMNEADGPVFKIHNDPRFTKIGRFLSHTGLDELPQLYNVLLGDMAFIGPRPLPVFEERRLTPKQKERESVLPGIISPWIINGHHTNTFDAWMKSDVTYVKEKSPQHDIFLLFRAVLFMVELVGRECIALYKTERQ